MVVCRLRCHNSVSGPPWLQFTHTHTHTGLSMIELIFSELISIAPQKGSKCACIFHLMPPQSPCTSSASSTATLSQIVPPVYLLDQTEGLSRRVVERCRMERMNDSLKLALAYTMCFSMGGEDVCVCVCACGGGGLGPVAIIRFGGLCL